MFRRPGLTVAVEGVVTTPDPYYLSRDVGSSLETGDHSVTSGLGTRLLSTLTPCSPPWSDPETVTKWVAFLSGGLEDSSL